MIGSLLLAACGQKNQENVAQAIYEEDVTPTDIAKVEGRENFNKAVITPQPAIMIGTYDATETPNVMMAAWGGQSGPNKIAVFLSHHRTTENLRLKRAFTVSFASKANVVESDYFGLVSGNDVPDKVARAGFTATKSPNIDAPIINEYPLTLECRLIAMEELKDGSFRVVGRVINTSADTSIMTDGHVDLDKLQPVIFDATTNTYRVVGEVVGQAWESGKAIQ